MRTLVSPYENRNNEVKADGGLFTWMRTTSDLLGDGLRPRVSNLVHESNLSGCDAASLSTRERKDKRHGSGSPQQQGSCPGRNSLQGDCV